jgi:hypothetical protein
MNEGTAELQCVATHEAGHVLASWFFTGQIVSVTLGSNIKLSGAVFSGCYNVNTLCGQRQAMIGTAAGAAAEGVEVNGDDLRRLEEAARRIVGLNGEPERFTEEIERAKVAAKWLTTEYATEIRTIADKLLHFHNLLANMERRHDPNGII